MSQDIIREVEKQHLKADPGTFAIGDTVAVHVRIKEMVKEGGKTRKGAKEVEKERLQAFIGTVIMRKGTGINEKFTVRRIVAGEGVERIFPVHSPAIAKIEVLRRGISHRAKLYYLRDRVGKATRLKERRAARRVIVVAGEETIAEREAREAADEARIRAAEQAKKAAEHAKKAAEKAAEEAKKAAKQAERAQKAEETQKAEGASKAEEKKE